jgi:chloride channel 2
MFSPVPLSEQTKVNWDFPSIGLNLVIFFVTKFIFIILSVSLPIPTGVFAPSLLLGSVFGRLYGFVLRQIFGDVINEAAYAVVGGAAVTASVTRTLSVAMIIFEINGELSYMIPVLTGVIVSYAISNSLCPSIFDILLDMKDLPYLPALRTENYYLTAEDVMKSNFRYLTTESKFSGKINYPL